MKVAASFLEFATRVCRVTLTPAQRVLCAVAFDGVDPLDLGAEDRAIAQLLFGDVGSIPKEARHVLCAVCGARAGKSYVLCALRLLHLALTVNLGPLARGELAAAVIVAPDLRLARQVLRYARGAAKAVGAIECRVTSETSDGFVLDRRGEGVVSVECLPATRGGSAVRGRSLVGAALDESAFFRDDSYEVNDVELFKAVAPRILPGGQIIVASTPWAASGLLHELFAQNRGKPATALAAHAPTLLLRPDDRTRSVVERERQRDPDNALREFDAEFLSGGSGLFFDPATIDAAIDENRPQALPPDASFRTFIGADFAFDRDSSALAVVQLRRDVVHLADVVELRPKPGAPLKPSDVVGAFAAVAHRYRVSTVLADVHYRRAVEEHLSKFNIALHAGPEGQGGKAESYVRLKTFLREGRVRLPNHPRLIAQLKSIIARPTPGGGLSITSPRRGASGHGDLVSALVLAVWSASRSTSVLTAKTSGPRESVQFHPPRSTQPQIVVDESSGRVRLTTKPSKSIFRGGF